MDALVVFGLAIYLAMNIKKEKPDIIKLEVKKNPNWYKDEKAFRLLFDRIMKGD